MNKFNNPNISNMNKNNEMPVNAGCWDKIFPQSNKVEYKKVSFKNRYGNIFFITTPPMVY